MKIEIMCLDNDDRRSVLVIEGKFKWVAFDAKDVTKKFKPGALEHIVIESKTHRFMYRTPNRERF